MKAQLLDMQFRAMTQSYRTAFPAAAFAIVTMDDVPIGQLILDTAEDRIHVVYIALLAIWRRRGIGSALLRAVLAKARALDLPCEATVAVDNVPSLRLWAALGFTEQTCDTANIVVKWWPSPRDDLADGTIAH
jgi:ribosomal protein S18 acetylase RimI-like enzyme